MPTQNVNLSEQQVNFIRKRIKEGRFRNSSEVVRAGLRLLEQKEQEDKFKLKALRRLAAGAFNEIDQGKFEEVEPESIDHLIARVDAKARAAKSR